MIACTIAPGRGDTDLILATLAHKLRGEGLRLCGTVQVNTDRADTGRCDMDVRVLPDGPTLRISQDLGRHARGCRLHPEALETAVGHAMRALERGADLLIINKFGKHEAEGRGFRGVIGEAVAQGIPVLVGLNALNVPAFEAFTGGIAEKLPPETDALLNWVRTHVNMPVAV